MGERTRAYLRLARPANLFTAAADILLGAAASGLVVHEGGWINGSFALTGASSLALLLLSTVGLYGGGVVFNDVFDAKIDAVERPERPIPSGRVSPRSAALFGAILLSLGVLAASFVSLESSIIAVAVAGLVLVYDAVAKRHSLLGPLTMGLCRGGNLMLGISAVPAALAGRWYLALIPLVYIAAVTMVSRGEVHGGKSSTLNGALGAYLAVMAGILALGLTPAFDIIPAIPFLLLFAVLTLPPLRKALGDPSPLLVRGAVKSGVLALVIMDAAIAAGYAGWGFALVVAALLPVSRIVAREFAVT